MSRTERGGLSIHCAPLLVLQWPRLSPEGCVLIHSLPLISERHTIMGARNAIIIGARNKIIGAILSLSKAYSGGTEQDIFGA